MPASGLHFAQGAGMPPEQATALTSDDGHSSALRLAVSRHPGLHIWRGERRTDEYGNPDPNLNRPKSVGMHWSANPDSILGGGNSGLTIWHGVIDKPEQAIPRDHPIWRGKHRSMDFEAELRLHPGSHVRILGRFDQQKLPKGENHVFAPLNPDRHHGYTYTPMGMLVPVEHAPDSQGTSIDYSALGIGK